MTREEEIDREMRRARRRDQSEVATLFGTKSPVMFDTLKETRGYPWTEQMVCVYYRGRPCFCFQRGQLVVRLRYDLYEPPGRHWKLEILSRDWLSSSWQSVPMFLDRWERKNKATPVREVTPGVNRD